VSSPPLAQVALVTYRDLPHLTEDDRLLIAPLRELGIGVEPVVWDDPEVNWKRFGAAIIRSTWDYQARPAKFRRWIDDCEAAGVRLYNSPRVVRWNLHKGYLRELADRGIPVVPTIWLRRGEEADLESLLESQGWRRAVVKPAISAGARQTWTVRREDAAERQRSLTRLLARKDVLVQPFLEPVTQEGEWSLLFFDGRFSHAALKKTSGGDFRVQEHFGGKVISQDPPNTLVKRAAEVLTTAAGILASDPSEFLYARVDGVRDGDRLVLVELEVLEPSLFLSLDPKAPARFAAAIARRLRKAAEPSSSHTVTGTIAP
jgi:hypothetical protein